MEIAFFEINKVEQAFIKKKLKGFKIKFFEEKIQEVEINKFKSVDIISVFIYSKVEENILSHLKNLKVVLTRSTGFDHIDKNYCESNNIQIGNVPTYGENTVAEHTFALILNLSRNVHKSYINSKTGNFDNSKLEGFDLKGKVIGIIGVGHIGMHVIRIAKGFGMHVKAFDLRQDTFTSEILHFEYTTIDDIIKKSDIISLHMPYNKHTHHFINKKRLSQMKKGAILINTSRGGLIDSNALYSSLKSGKLAGVGLDVIEGEEMLINEDNLIDNSKATKKTYNLFKDKEIVNMDNVIFTPHNAFNSKEAKERILNTTINNANEFKKTKSVKYLVK